MVTFFVSGTVQKLSDETEKANPAVRTVRTAHVPTRHLQLTRMTHYGLKQLVRSITVPLTQRLFLVKAGSPSHGPKPRT